MIPAIIAMWLLAAPAGYLAGAAFARQNKMSGAEVVPWFAAAVPPLAAMLAVMVLMREGIDNIKEEEAQE